MLVEILVFSIFCAKKLKKYKKVTNLVQNLVKFSKITFDLSLHQRDGWMFYSQIEQVFSMNAQKLVK